MREKRDIEYINKLRKKYDMEIINDLFAKAIKQAEVEGRNIAMMWRCPLCGITFPEEEQVSFALHRGECKP